MRRSSNLEDFTLWDLDDSPAFGSIIEAVAIRALACSWHFRVDFKLEVEWSLICDSLPSALKSPLHLC